jgi:hypothetical protein
MSDRNKPHLGRKLDGDREKPYDTLVDAGDDPIGTGRVADQVQLDGARADVGINATRHADEIQAEIDRNRACVDKFRHPDAGPTSAR